MVLLQSYSASTDIEDAKGRTPAHLLEQRNKISSPKVYWFLD